MICEEARIKATCFSQIVSSLEGPCFLLAVRFLAAARKWWKFVGTKERIETINLTKFVVVDVTPGFTTKKKDRDSRGEFIFCCRNPWLHTARLEVDSTGLQRELRSHARLGLLCVDPADRLNETSGELKSAGVVSCPANLS